MASHWVHSKEWQVWRNRVEDAWRSALEGQRQIRALTTLFRFADRLAGKAPQDLRSGLAARMLLDCEMAGPDWSRLFRHYMQEGPLSPEEKIDVARWIMNVRYDWEIDRHRAARRPEDAYTWLVDWSTRQPTEGVRHAAVWRVELGDWTPSEGVDYCLDQLAWELKKSGPSSPSWAEGASDILLGWRGAFPEKEALRILEQLRTTSRLDGRRVGYRAGVILLGRDYALQALEDPARPVREAAKIWLTKGPIDKPPPGLKEMKPYPRLS